MLQVKNIYKKYVTGELQQIALNDVSLNLRDNEFVAILGQSGSGKTTLLNVIGGLDRYDSGDLIINGISTKDYNDRDWDSYRNHTIGFVFQSYNLIPHQSVLANVELALTISGISGAEKRQRATEALNKVGLGNQLHKKPNQMSGGQMQRVAIARALVNNPDILLADEPTGALDSETSIQVMDLLKEVAKDRLVVMVTHNPELAEEYATRIVRLSDGKIVDDSDPFIVDDSAMDAPKHQNMGKASMSFLTSLALSFNNLRTKKGRTFLTSFAGSIGIIGIALILSLSNGVNTYIHNIEEETLSEYPVTITSTNVDITSMMTLAASSSVDEKKGEEVNERKTISSLFSQSKKNDLRSLRNFLESDQSKVYDYANAVEYSYSITPNIYRIDSKGYYQVNPNESFEELNQTYGAMASQLPYNVFSSLPQNEVLYKDQYEVIEGHWPENNHQLVLVLSADNCVTDVALYVMEIKDPKNLDAMMKDYKDGKEVNEVSEIGKYKYSDFLGKQFKLVNVADTYRYDSKRKIYVSKTDDESFMSDLIRNGSTLEITGIVRKTDSSKAGMLTSGIYYPYELENEVVEASKNSKIVQAQLKNPDVNVFTGNRFDDESKKNSLEDLFQFDTDAIMKAFNGKNVKFDSSMLSGMDLSNIKIDMNDLDFDISGLGNLDWAKILSKINVKVNQAELSKMFNAVLAGYLEHAASDPSTDFQKLPDAISEYLKSEEAAAIIEKDMKELLEQSIQVPSSADMNAFVQDIVNGFVEYMQQYPDAQISELSSYLNAYLNSPAVQQKIAAFIGGFDISAIDPNAIQKILTDLSDGYNDYASKNNLPDPTKLQDSFMSYIQSEEGQKIIKKGIENSVNMDELEKQFAEVLSDVMDEYSSTIEKMMSKVMQQISSQISSGLASMVGNLYSSMSNMMNFDANTFADAMRMSIDEKELQEAMMSLMTKGQVSYESNLLNLNYCELNNPTAISIYPKDFENKTKITKMLNNYNKRMEKTGQEDKVVSFTDYVATLMSSVTDIIDTISYVLIAFVAISLVVSSIMIGIITYISVLERTKEIGILRAIGASKPNISQVFNAETFIIGLLAGVLGIVITLLLLIPGNMLIHYLTGGTEVSAILPWQGAIILIIISVILTLIGGIIPSRAAAKKDPVTALRSE
ncbi:MAG: ABC transporter ATP-binding protein/permease [Bacillota bacterium]|nr:ABC transporter ATP-binding protein/permease [Bacillota bacterium]